MRHVYSLLVAAALGWLVCTAFFGPPPLSAVVLGSVLGSFGPPLVNRWWGWLGRRAERRRRLLK